MIYTVQVFEAVVIETPDGESGSPAYTLNRRFSTIPLAEEAGLEEVRRLRQEGRFASFNIFDPEGRPCGPTGRSQPVDPTAEPR